MSLVHHLIGAASQFDRVDPRQVKNSDGAYVFPVDPFVQLERFLVLGSSGGTYYASERTVTRERLCFRARSCSEARRSPGATSPRSAASRRVCASRA